MAEDIKYTRPTDDRILTDRQEVNKTINDTLTNLGGLEDGTLAQVDAIPNTVGIRDSYGRLKATHAINGKTDGTKDYLVNVGLLLEQLDSLKKSLGDIYFTKEETSAEIQRLIDELIAKIGDLDVDNILQANKLITDHIAVTDRPHGATPTLFPSSIPYRDSYGQFEVGVPTKDTHVARYDTVKNYLAGVDVEFLRNIQKEMEAIESILTQSLILWEYVDNEINTNGSI